MNTKIDTNPTPKTHKKINRDTYWMYKFLFWAWGKENVPKYRGYCPLFWSLWITLALTITFIIPIGKVFEFLGSIVTDLYKINSKTSDTEIKPTKYPKPDDSWIVFVFEEFTKNYKSWKQTTKYNTEDEFIYHIYWNCGMSYQQKNWFLTTPNWREFYPVAKENQARKEKSALIRAERKEKIDAKINVLVNKTSWMLKPGIVIVSLYAALWIFRGTMFVVTNLIGWITEILTLGFVWNVFQAVVLLVIAIFIVGFLAKTLMFLKNKLDSIPENPRIVTETESHVVTQFINNIVNFIGEFFGVIRDTIQMTYKKECPLIQYGEENGPIEKNSKPETPQ